jgi:hypothetical protein
LQVLPTGDWEGHGGVMEHQVSVAVTLLDVAKRTLACNPGSALAEIAVADADEEDAVLVRLEEDVASPVLEALVTNGALVDRRCTLGNTPLLDAAYHGNTTELQGLLPDADLLAANADGRTPRRLARVQRHFDAVDAIDDEHERQTHAREAAAVAALVSASKQRAREILLVCPVCLDPYVTERPAHTLSCGHALCHNCVEDMMATAASASGIAADRRPRCRCGALVAAQEIETGVWHVLARDDHGSRGTDSDSDSDSDGESDTDGANDSRKRRRTDACADQADATLTNLAVIARVVQLAQAVVHVHAVAGLVERRQQLLADRIAAHPQVTPERRVELIAAVRTTTTADAKNLRLQAEALEVQVDLCGFAEARLQHALDSRAHGDGDLAAAVAFAKARLATDIPLAAFVGDTLRFVVTSEPALVRVPTDID